MLSSWGILLRMWLFRSAANVFPGHSKSAFLRNMRKKFTSGNFQVRQIMYLLLCLWLCMGIDNAGAESTEWVKMPAGGRSAYIGINGGTVPVSILTSRDGSTMVTLVGRTGNDFLETLGRAESGLSRQAGGVVPPPTDPNLTLLQAHTAAGIVPVIYAAGNDFSRMDLSEKEWLPYGLSATALQVEGRPVKPLHLSKTRKYRHIFLSGGIMPFVVARR